MYYIALYSFRFSCTKNQECIAKKRCAMHLCTYCIIKTAINLIFSCFYICLFCIQYYSVCKRIFNVSLLECIPWKAKCCKICVYNIFEIINTHFIIIKIIFVIYNIFFAFSRSFLCLGIFRCICIASTR